jgi:hypothetical protein
VCCRSRGQTRPSLSAVAARTSSIHFPPPCLGPGRTCCPQPNGTEVCGANCGGGRCCKPGLECCGKACISPDTHGCCGNFPYILDTQKCCITTDARSTLSVVCAKTEECCVSDCCKPNETVCQDGRCVPCPPGETFCGPCRRDETFCGNLRVFGGGPICCPSGTQCCGLGDGEQHCCLPGTECCDIQGAVQAICIPTGTTCCGAPGLESRSCPPAAPVCCTDLPTGVFARAYCCRSGAECCEGACCGPGTYCCRVPSPDATGNDTACCFLGQTCGVIDGIFRCTAP